MAAFVCFAGSILSLALGFALTTDWLLNAVRHPVLHAVGITLLMVGIPILILGGHCLDLMDKKNKKSDRVGKRCANNPKTSKAAMRPSETELDWPGCSTAAAIHKSNSEIRE